MLTKMNNDHYAKKYLSDQLPDCLVAIVIDMIGLTDDFIEKYKQGYFGICDLICDPDTISSFFRKSPSLVQKIGDLYFDDFYENISYDEKVEIIWIEYIDRGVDDWSTFEYLLRIFCPNLRCLFFSQNYSTGHNMETHVCDFIKNMKLDILHISWSQGGGNLRDVNLIHKFQSENSVVTIAFGTAFDKYQPSLIKSCHLKNKSKETNIYI